MLTIVCQKTSGGMGGCAEDPGMAAYEDASYPNAAVIQVPALQPGETFDHVLEFWGGLVWGAGTYELTLTADAGDAIPEDDEENNQTRRKSSSSPASTRRRCRRARAPSSSSPRATAAAASPSSCSSRSGSKVSSR